MPRGDGSARTSASQQAVAVPSRQPPCHLSAVGTTAVTYIPVDGDKERMTLDLLHAVDASTCQDDDTQGTPVSEHALLVEALSARSHWGDCHRQAATGIFPYRTAVTTHEDVVTVPATSGST